MASRLLAQLAARIAAARDPVQAACLRAQRGIYLARQGKLQQAEAIVRALREEFGSRPNAEVTAWISLVEALNHFYSQPGPQALDRLKRAHALSRAMNHPLLVPLCAAWLAHIEFNANRMEPMLQYAVEALRLAQPDHHATLARVSLVIADAFHYAGRFDLAKDWYAAVREHALADGDDAMISAMLHNVAALRANQVRLADAFGEAQATEGKRALLELESTKNYDLGIGAAAWASFIPLVRAQLFVTEHRFAEAIPLYGEALEKNNRENLERRAACFYADRAWCHFKLGAINQAIADVEKACEFVQKAEDPDDRASTEARIAAILDETGEGERAAEHRRRAIQFRLEHSDAQAELLFKLQDAFRSSSMRHPQLPN
jgi:tetratricopeptide (TPR) repeat protein